MLDEETLNKFIANAGGAYSVFCVWMYTNNKYVENEKFLNSPKKEGLCFSTEEWINNCCRYKNFFPIVIPSLQQTWLTATARLLDPAYFRCDQNKPRLSIHYIKEQLDDKNLTKWIEDKLDKQNTFVHSIKNIRNKILAHNDLNSVEKCIKAGVENFFKTLKEYTQLVKNNKSHLAGCNNLVLDKIDLLSKNGVKEIFEKIIPE